MLTSKFSLILQPIVKQTRLGFYYLKRLKSYVFVTFGLIIGIDGLQRTVKYCGELIYRFGLHCELYYPLMTAFGFIIHEYWSGGIFLHLSTGGDAGLL
jgi:hypothetical protein